MLDSNSLSPSEPIGVGVAYSAPEPAPVDYCRSIWQRFGMRVPRAIVFPETVIPHFRRLREVFDIVDDGDVDVILLTNERQLPALEAFRGAKKLFLAPVIDLTGRANFATDAEFDPDAPKTWHETAARIKMFADNKIKLSQRFRSPGSNAARLLSYMFVSGQVLQPVRVPQSRYFFGFRGLPDTRTIRGLADVLAEKGLLKRNFFDRHHECSNCNSHRMIVREECPDCQSPDLREADLIHHFGCAQLGPDTAFRQGGALICPKCSKQLRHYGKDYDKPGQIHICGRCNGTSSEPRIGFVCQDCEMHFDGDAVKAVDIFSYSLSARALELLTTEYTVIESEPASRFRTLPGWLQHETQKLSTNCGTQRDCVVAEVKYDKTEALIKAQGPVKYDKLRHLFADNLQGAVAGIASVHRTRERDYVIFFGAGRRDVEKSAPQILDKCDAVLANRLHPSLNILWTGCTKAVL